MKVRFAVLFLILGGMTCAAQEQSLGDVARQQKAVSHTKAKRVITDENLPHASLLEAMNGAVVVPGAPASAGTANSADDKTPAAKDPNAPPASAGDAQKRLDDVKAMEEAQQRAVKKFEEELKDDSISSDRRQLFEDGLANAKQLLAQATQEREKIEQAVTPASGGTSADTRSDEEKPADAKPADDKSAQDKAADTKPADAKAEDSAKPDETRNQ